jgi:hypothetical protein
MVRSRGHAVVYTISAAARMIIDTSHTHDLNGHVGLIYTISTVAHTLSGTSCTCDSNEHIYDSNEHHMIRMDMLPWDVCTHYCAHCTLRIAHCILHIAHCTLHIALLAQPIALHDSNENVVLRSVVHTVAHCTLNSAE